MSLEKGLVVCWAESGSRVLGLILGGHKEIWDDGNILTRIVAVIAQL